MDVIGEIKAGLSKYPGVACQSGKHYITVQPKEPDGFSVRLYACGSELTVSFEGWHEVFLDAEEALSCFAFGLSDACRLEVEFRGRMATRWAVQSLNDGSWVTDSEVGLILIPFWHRKRIVYRQNHLLLVI